MQRLIIICEGATEQEFCKQLLATHLISKGINVSCPTIKKTNGGIANWASLKIQIENHCKQEPDAYITTLIDYYGIKASHQFPVKGAPDAMQQGMFASIDERFRHRFIPYLQLHEFESILFHEALLETNAIPNENWKDKPAFEEVLSLFPNPEDINNLPETCPSARLTKIFRRYSKPVLGIHLAKTIGLENIRARNPRFDLWLQMLEELV